MWEDKKGLKNTIPKQYGTGRDIVERGAMEEERNGNANNPISKSIAPFQYVKGVREGGK